MLIKKKIDYNLKYCIDNKMYNNYRVIIIHSLSCDSIRKKIISLKGNFLFSIPSLNCVVATVSSMVIKRLIELPEIKHIIMDNLAQLCSHNHLSNSSNNIPPIPYYNKAVNTFAREHNLSGKNVGIGIIDSGVYPHAELLKPKNKIHTFVDLINNLSYPYDDNGHGTFVAGELCKSGLYNEKGHTGLCTGSHLIMVKAFNSLGRSYISSTLLALNYLYENINELSIKIIYLPFETFTLSEIIYNLYEKIFSMINKKGCTIVVPSGHNGDSQDSMNGIACHPSVITVGGYENSIVPSYSSCGSSKVLKKPDFIAPSAPILTLNSDTNYISERDGEKIYASALKSLYCYNGGTTLSSIYITGICALLYEYNNNYSKDDVYNILKHSSQFIKDMKYKQGNGLIDLETLLPKKN